MPVQKRRRHRVARELKSARIAGPLTLTHLTLRCPLELRDCHLESDVDLTKAIGSDLSLAGSHLHGTLQGRRLRLDHVEGQAVR